MFLSYTHVQLEVNIRVMYNLFLRCISITIISIHKLIYYYNNCNLFVAIIYKITVGDRSTRADIFNTHLPIVILFHLTSVNSIIIIMQCY